MNLSSPSSIPTFQTPILGNKNPYSRSIISMATSDNTKRTVRATSALEARVSLVLALAAQTSALSQRCKELLELMLLFAVFSKTRVKIFEGLMFVGVFLVSWLLSVLMDLATETARYVFPSRRFESRNLEEALMSGTLQFSWCNFQFSFWSRILLVVCIVCFIVFLNWLKSRILRPWNLRFWSEMTGMK